MVNKAREYVGTPYHHSGRDKNGVDCAGVLYCIFKDLGKPLRPIPMYGRLTTSKFLLDQVEENFTFVTGHLDDALPGDILLIRFNKTPQHLAVYTGDTIIHSYEKSGAVVEQRLNDMWKKRIVGVYRSV